MNKKIKNGVISATALLLGLCYSSLSAEDYYNYNASGNFNWESSSWTDKDGETELTISSTSPTTSEDNMYIYAESSVVGNSTESYVQLPYSSTRYIELGSLTVDLIDDAGTATKFIRYIRPMAWAANTNIYLNVADSLDVTTTGVGSFVICGVRDNSTLTTYRNLHFSTTDINLSGILTFGYWDTTYKQATSVNVSGTLTINDGGAFHLTRVGSGFVDDQDSSIITDSYIANLVNNSTSTSIIRGSDIYIGALSGTGDFQFNSLKVIDDISAITAGALSYGDIAIGDINWVEGEYSVAVGETYAVFTQTNSTTGTYSEMSVYIADYDADKALSDYTSDEIYLYKETTYEMAYNSITFTGSDDGSRSDYNGQFIIGTGGISIGSTSYSQELHLIAASGANQAFRNANTQFTTLTINDGAQVHLNSTTDAGAGTGIIYLNSGGKLGAIGADYTYYAEEIGTLEAKSLTWASGGALMVDVASSTQQYVIDTIVLSEGLYKAEGDTGNVFYIEFTALEDISIDYDYRFLEVYGDIDFDGSETFIGTVDNGNLTITEENPGYCVESIWLEEYTNSSGESGYALYVSFAVVPEPSTYALIFGLLSLGFVYYRKRK